MVWFGEQAGKFAFCDVGQGTRNRMALPMSDWQIVTGGIREGVCLNRPSTVI